MNVLDTICVLSRSII